MSLYLSRLRLTHFRNYPELDLTFDPGINCLVGPNGAGKTNVLDALHYLAFTRGFRHHQDRQAVLEGEDFFFNGGTLQKGGRAYEIHCNFVKNKGKRVLVDQKPLEKMSDHIGSLPMVTVLPADTDLINGPAAGRRRFLDMLISQYDHAYLLHLIQYDRLLQQRNALLKQFAEQRHFDPVQLEVYDAQLIPHGVALGAGRQQFLEDFAPIFEGFFRAIVSEKEVPHLRYRSQLKENSPAAWQELLAQQQEKDRVNLFTTAGAHRDDLVFKIDESSVRNFGSQGQQKTFIIALKLAQYRLLEARSGWAPLLLLDDIFDKLDEHRLGSIVDILDRDIGGQVFITDTSADRLRKVFSADLKRQPVFFSVQAGQAVPLDLA